MVIFHCHVNVLTQGNHETWVKYGISPPNHLSMYIYIYVYDMYMAMSESTRAPRRYVVSHGWFSRWMALPMVTYFDSSPYLDGDVTAMMVE